MLLIKVKIIEIFLGATDPETGITWDYDIKAKLKSGKRIGIFDSEPFNLHDYIGKEVDLLIHAGFLSIAKTEDLHKTNKYGDIKIIQGKYIRNYILSEEWDKQKIRKHNILETEDGIFILGSFSNREREIIDGESIALHVGRFDLIDWYLT